MSNEQRLQYQITELQKQWELVSQKLSKLEHNRILETSTEERFRLDHRIAEVQAEREQLEQQLRELESQLEQQRFHTYIPKVYHNLPQPDYGRFVGREAELTKVERILQPYPHSQHSVVTIDGIGGIGKSALALEIAHRYLRNFDNLEPER
jgi:septal ring factor EnvC (AmiA/AmiB activator)